MYIIMASVVSPEYLSVLEPVPKIIGLVRFLRDDNGDFLFEGADILCDMRKPCTALNKHTANDNIV